MIKFERKNTKKAEEAIQVLKEAREKDLGYNKPEVNAALFEMFLGKCYICENKAVSSFQIEHLIPHRKNLNLKYDWNNLFLACAHCNNMKSAKYEPILDCSKIDVDRIIAFRKEGFFGRQEKFVFIPLKNDVATKNTAMLLREVYYGNTPQKKMEATNIRRILRKDLSDFKNLIRDYEEAEEYEREDYLAAIRKEVSAGAPFAAFKRWILWDNGEKYRDLIKACGL